MFHPGGRFVALTMIEEGPPWRIRALRGILRRLPRGRYGALAALGPTRGRFTAQLANDAGGAKFACDMGDQISREVCLTGLYEPPVTRVFQHHLPAGGTAVDLGANWGYFSLLAAASAGPGGTVLALEPDPRQFEALSGNVALNGFRQVSPLQVAASAREGRVSLVGYDEGDTNRGVSRIAGPSAPGRRFDVRSTSVDLLTAATPRVDIVKIDVEGAEDAVLDGMRDGLSARRYRALVVELHPDILRANGIDPAACLSRVGGHGYRGWTIDLGPDAYRRAIDPAVAVESLLLPLDRWRDTPWPHLLWLC
jgi:FkbM family methyltransferase